MKVFYHDDADGKCAARIIRKTLGDGVKFFSINYSDVFPLDIIENGEDVAIVDFSIEPEVMKDLMAKTERVIWIDHHVSAIDVLSEFSHVEGLRSVDFSGCELTWLYFKRCFCGHNLKLKEERFSECPFYIRLIGDRDTWRFKFGDRAKWFHELFKLYGEPGPEEDDEWDRLENEAVGGMKSGEMLCRHTDMINKAIVDRWAYETDFEGYRILVCNSSIFGSTLFGRRFGDYPFVAVCCYNGIKWSVGLYSETMDVVDIAKKYGGGGHPRACGFDLDSVPFVKKEE